MTRNTDAHAMPTNAAEIKQFWYPKSSIHGVILITGQWFYFLLGEDRGDSPITNCKGHSISHQDDASHRHSTEFPVAVNHIIDAQGNATGVGEG